MYPSPIDNLAPFTELHPLIDITQQLVPIHVLINFMFAQWVATK
jgi:hypothetical protein